MGRVIKFRAWSEELAQMGVFKGAFFEFVGKGGHPLECWYLDAASESQGIHVIQFTGLHDKNGAEIYEGDIVRKKCAWVVYWDNEPMTYMLRSGRCVMSLCEFFKDGGIEVIGNIHQNPELLEPQS